MKSPLPMTPTHPPRAAEAAQHTAGPWSVTCSFERADETVPWETDVSSNDFGAATSYGRTREESEANAQLIAAAPENEQFIEHVLLEIRGILGMDPLDSRIPKLLGALAETAMHRIVASGCGHQIARATKGTP